jgi:hypothetical protein
MPPQEDDPHQQRPMDLPPIQPGPASSYVEVPNEQPPAERQLDVEEHPFIEPQVGNTNDPSLKRRLILWYATRIGALVVVLGLFVGGGVGVYNAYHSGDAQPKQDTEQALYEGDGSDISKTTIPNSDWVCAEGYSNDPKDETICVSDATKTAALTKAYSCEDGYIKYGEGDNTSCQKVTGQSSTRTAKASISYTCPSGYSRSGTKCSRTLTATPSTTYTCPSGYTRNGTKCTKTTISYGGVIASCPSGYKKSGRGTSATCTKTIEPNANGTCKSGFKKRNGKCVRTVMPSFSCPSGYAKSGSGRNTRCSKITVTTISATATKTCPSGYSLSGSSCSRTSTTSASARYSCPSGYGLSGATCYQTIGGTVTKVKPIVKTSCPSGYKQSSDGKRCEGSERDKKEAVLVQTCEEGWKLLKDETNGSQCVLTEE